MLWNYSLYLLITWFCSQTLKLLFKPHKKSLKHIRDTFLFFSGAPSSHSSVLAMTLLYIKHKTTTNNPIFIVVLVFSTLWIYEIYMQRKRFSELVELLDIKKTKLDYVKRNEEFHGHAVFDIISGLALGTAIFEILNLFL